jgi:NAD+ kinase
MTAIHTIGMVLHPQRDAADAVDTILLWAHDHQVTVLGLEAEVARLNCGAVAVSERELGERADLLVALGGDGTVPSAGPAPEPGRGGQVPTLTGNSRCVGK